MLDTENHQSTKWDPAAKIRRSVWVGRDHWRSQSSPSPGRTRLIAASACLGVSG